MLVNKKDGKCACGGQFEIIGVDDCSLETECCDCGDESRVEIDAFNDGGIKYWPEAMVEFGEDQEW